MLAGCGGSQPPIGAPAAMLESGTSTELGSRATSSGYSVLHGFTGGQDGKYPLASLIVFRGKLYGTTCEGSATNDGTVFTISASGAEKTVYSFIGSSGECPAANLIPLKDTLYGTTAKGGTNGLGTVFSVTKGGKESMLYSFRGRNDGYQPLGGLTVHNGVLYGTTYYGDTYCGYHSKLFGCGTIFSITTSGNETVLHKFNSDAPYYDGSNPAAGLIFSKGAFYGTTSAGGTHDLGTVFTVDATGKESVIHNFENGNGDGYLPLASLIAVKGVLYGTTPAGGAGTDCAGAGGCGTVFSITPSGKETIVYSFQGGSDGSFPAANVIAVNGTIYGTTEFGGAYCGGNGGCGTIFSVNATGQEQVLHSFAGGSDGNGPVAGLKFLNGTLYGTTGNGGGSSSCYGGCGTVFALQLQPH
jgi:uncharacterized repeat protein (TIGR03803 family)